MILKYLTEVQLDYFFPFISSLLEKATLRKCIKGNVSPNGWRSPSSTLLLYI
jgi:hypothetical protein